MNDIHTNPHTLWKQILGLSIASIITFIFSGNILLVFTGLLTFLDAWMVGIYKREVGMYKRKGGEILPQQLTYGMGNCYAMASTNSLSHLSH